MFRDAFCVSTTEGHATSVQCEGEQKFIKIGRHFNFRKKPSILGNEIIPGIFLQARI